MPRPVPRTQINASLPSSLHRHFRIQLAIDGDLFQAWVERAVRRYVSAAPEPAAPAPRKIKRTAQEGDAA